MINGSNTDAQDFSWRCCTNDVCMQHTVVTHTDTDTHKDKLSSFCLSPTSITGGPLMNSRGHLANAEANRASATESRSRIHHSWRMKHIHVVAESADDFAHVARSLQSPKRQIHPQCDELVITGRKWKNSKTDVSIRTTCCLLTRRSIRSNRAGEEKGLVLIK